MMNYICLYSFLKIRNYFLNKKMEIQILKIHSKYVYNLININLIIFQIYLLVTQKYIKNH